MSRRDPIKRVELGDGRVRYRFVIDVGKKPDGRRDQRTFTYDTLREARAEYARIRHEVGRGTYCKPNRSLTVEAYLGQWLASKRHKKPSTFRCYQDSLKPITGMYGRLPLQALDSPHLEQVKAAMLSGEARRIGRAGEPLSPRSVNLMLTVAGMALRAAMARGLVVRDVAALVERVPGDTDRSNRDGWQPEHGTAFLRSTRADRLHAAWWLSMLGLRRGEVLGLRWADVDLDAGTLRVEENRTTTAGEIHVGTPKSRASKRPLPMPQPVIDALRELRKRQAEERLAAGVAYGNAEDRVVVDEIGEPPKPQWYSDRFERLITEAGLPRITLHGCRHHAASLMASLHVPIVVAAAWLGQSQQSITAQYQHAFADQLAAASEALGEALAG